MPRRSQESQSQDMGSHLILNQSRATRRQLQGFIQEGLKRNEKVILVIPGESFADYLATVQEGEFAENLRTHSEQVALLLEEEVLIEAERVGREDALRMFLEDLVRRGIAEGWARVRFAHLGVTWGEPLGTRWEDAWDYLRGHFNITILCLYDAQSPAPPHHIVERHASWRGTGK